MSEHCVKSITYFIQRKSNEYLMSNYLILLDFQLQFRIDWLFWMMNSIIICSLIPKIEEQMLLKVQMISLWKIFFCNLASSEYSPL